MKKPDALHYENRKGDVYLLQEGKTSTGKPKYFVSRKLTGTPLPALPEGYELHERPENAQVFVRKVKASPITEFERRQAEAGVRRASGLKHFVVEIEDDALVVYTPSTSHRDVDRLIDEIAGPSFFASSKADEYREMSIKRSNYVKMLRFQLIDPDSRRYAAERWCFRGSIDRWIPLMQAPGTLAELVDRYAKHLDRESFFELM